MRIGLGNFVAEMLDEENGLMMLICLGTNGTLSPLLLPGVGEISRIVGGDVCPAVDGLNDDLAIAKRITRGAFGVDGISCVV